MKWGFLDDDSGYFYCIIYTERITHYTLLRKVVCQMGRCPLWKPPQEKAVRYPSTGRIPPFLVIQPSGCIG